MFSYFYKHEFNTFMAPDILRLDRMFLVLERRFLPQCATFHRRTLASSPAFQNRLHNRLYGTSKATDARESLNKRFPSPGTAVSANPKPMHLAEHVLTTFDQIVNWARQSWMWPLSFGLACCALEMMQVSMPRYDQDRLGIIFHASPRQSESRLQCAYIGNCAEA